MNNILQKKQKATAPITICIKVAAICLLRKKILRRWYPGDPHPSLKKRILSNFKYMIKIGFALGNKAGMPDSGLFAMNDRIGLIYFLLPPGDL